MIEKYAESLKALQTTITNYDNKASSLLTAVGIVFGFSIFSITELINFDGKLKWLVAVLGVLYLINFLLLMIVLCFVVFPRRKNKQELQDNLVCPLYSEDLYDSCKKGMIREVIEKEMDINVYIDQIKICSRITHKKENLLRIGTVLIISFSAILSALVLFLVL